MNHSFLAARMNSGGEIELGTKLPKHARARPSTPFHPKAHLEHTLGVLRACWSVRTRPHWSPFYSLYVYFWDQVSLNFDRINTSLKASCLLANSASLKVVKKQLEIQKISEKLGFPRPRKHLWTHLKSQTKLLSARIHYISMNMFSVCNENDPIYGFGKHTPEARRVCFWRKARPGGLWAHPCNAQIF